MTREGLAKEIERLRSELAPKPCPLFVVSGEDDDGGELVLVVATGGNPGFAFEGPEAECFYRRWRSADPAKRQELVREAERSGRCCPTHPPAED